MEMNALLVPMPNVPANVEFILQKLAPDFIILLGGNTPVAYGGTSPQRDSVDEELITYAIRKHILLLGVCRGAQSIAIYFDSTLKKVENHIAVKHFGQKTDDIKKVQSQYIGLMRFKNDGLKALLDLAEEAKERSENGYKLWRTDRDYSKMYMTDLLMGIHYGRFSVTIWDIRKKTEENVQ